MTQVIKGSRMAQDATQSLNHRERRHDTRDTPQRRFTRRYFDFVGGPSP